MDWAGIAIRFALYLDLMLASGLAAFALTAPAGTARVMPLRAVLVACGCLGLVLSAGGLLVMTAAMAGPRDVVVSISNTGTTREVVQATGLARARGARTIGITGSDGPLLDNCDIGIRVETLENTDVFTPTISRVAAMVVIDILSTAVSLGRDAAHHGRIAEMKRHLAEMRASGAY